MSNEQLTLASKFANDAPALRSSIPPRYPTCDVSREEIYTGIDQEKVSGLEAGSAICVCAICSGVPRLPILMPKCPHIMCEACAYHYFRENRLEEEANAVFLKCPSCNTKNNVRHIKCFSEWTPYEKALYIQHKAKCEDCKSIVDDPVTLLDHRLYYCQQRTVLCPNLECDFKAPAHIMKMKHLPVCDKFAVICPVCHRIVSEKQIKEHKCTLSSEHKCFELKRPEVNLNGIFYTIEEKTHEFTNIKTLARLLLEDQFKSRIITIKARNGPIFPNVFNVGQSNAYERKIIVQDVYAILNGEPCTYPFSESLLRHYFIGADLNDNPVLEFDTRKPGYRGRVLPYKLNRKMIVEWMNNEIRRMPTGHNYEEIKDC